MAATSYYNPKTGTGWRKIQTGPNKGKYQAYRNFKPTNRIKSNLTIGSGVAKFISKTVKAGQKSISDSTERRQTLMIGKGTKENPEYISHRSGKKKNPKYRPPDTSTTASNTESTTTKGDPFGREIAKIAQGGSKTVTLKGSNTKKSQIKTQERSNESQKVDENQKGVPPKNGDKEKQPEKKEPKHWIRTPLEQEMGSPYKGSEASRRDARRKKRLAAEVAAARKKKEDKDKKKSVYVS
tara:strand:+ start:526 stop:1242 length:717 start_codon:yes stop_codon:yes gene_type:complete